MDPVIKSLVIKRFRSIPADHVELANPTVFVGRNGSGKSNFVDVFAFLSEAMSSPLQAVFDRRGGISSVRNRSSGMGYPPNLGLRVNFGPTNGWLLGGNYSFEIKAMPNYGFEVVREQCFVTGKDSSRFWFDRSQTKFASNIEGLRLSLEPAALGLPLVGGHPRFAPFVRILSSMNVYSIDPHKLRDMQDPDSGITLSRDGSNAASVLREVERASTTDRNQIWEVLEKIVPQTVKVETKKHGNKLSLEFTQTWGEKKRLKFEAFNMSDGTLRVLGLLLAVYQKPSPRLLVIEEPESTIHPGVLGAVLDLLRHASSRMQLLVTTHSPEVLNAEWINDEGLRLVVWKDGATHVARVSDASRKILQEHLMGAGELLQANALDPQPLFQSNLDQLQLFEESQQ